MPLYLVRWPDLSAALVKARSEEELLLTLDEISNPEGCTWTIYRGPLCLEFSLPVQVRLDKPASATTTLRPEQIHIDEIDKSLTCAEMRVSVPVAQAASDMLDAILRSAFPNVYGAVVAGDEEPTDAQLRAALHRDLEPLVRSSWRRQNVMRSQDPASRLAAATDMSVAHARMVLAQVTEQRPKGRPNGPKPRRKR